MWGFFEPKVPQVFPEKVKQSLDEKEACILLDVRTPAEFARGNIADSVNVHVDDIKRDIESVVADKHTKIYVYCLSGSRSVYAVREMVSLGYTNVFDMRYGLLGWRAHYFPVTA